MINTARDLVDRCAIVLRSVSRVLALGAVLSAVAGGSAAYWNAIYNQKVAAERFDGLTAQAVDKIRRQIQTYHYGLRGLGGVVTATGDQWSLETFRQYSASRNIGAEFPGARGFGFIKIVPREQTAQFVEDTRNEGRPDFKIQELGENAGTRFVVQYYDSTTDDDPASGIDIASDPGRRKTALAAIEAGEARLTAPIVLINIPEEQNRGLVFLNPIYSQGMPKETPEQRRAAAIGWSFATLVVNDFMDGAQVSTDELAMSISDRTEKPAVPLFSTPGPEKSRGAGTLLRHVPLKAFGRDWDIDARALPPFFERLNLINPALSGSAVLVVGLLSTCLLHLHLIGLNQRERAWRERSRLASMVAESSEAIIGLTLTGEVTDWNPAAERLFGYTASEALGCSLAGLIIPEHLLKEREAAARHLLETGSMVQSTTQRRSRNGKILDMVVNLSPIRSEAGAIVGIGTSARDITSFVRAQREVESLNTSLEEQVAAKTAELKAITNAIPSMIAYWDKDLRCGFANSAYRDWSRRGPETVIGGSTISVLSERLFTENELYIRAALAGHAQNFERSLVRADGTTGHTWTNFVPHRSERGEVLGFFVMMTDVTALWKAERRLEATEARYRQLAENSSDMIFQLDRDLVRRYVSPACQQILGYDAGELIGTKPLDQVHPDDAARLTKIYRSLLDGEVDRDATVNRLRHCYGHWIWVEATLRVLRDPLTGNVTGILGALRDVTARKVIEAELESARVAAEDAARIKSEFIAAMSHELRTPLNSIIGFSRLILASPTPKDPVIENRVRLIHGASKTLLSIVNDVLDVSKLEADRLELDIRCFSLRSLVKDTLELLQEEADSKNLELRAEIAADVPENLLGDDNRLRQILVNLISNALKFTARGSVSVTVVRQGSPSEVGTSGTARLRVGIRDTGIGIPQSARKRIFHKFSQVDGTIARSYGGTGLGLSICKRLVEAMGGDIDFDSKKGEGSEFWFTVELPITAQGPAASEAGDDIAEMGSGRIAKLLLAEDNPQNQQLAVAILEQWGHSVDIVSNGAEAIEAVSREDYDIVLMDVQMPVIDGVEATTRIRSLGGRNTTIPIIAMTASVLVDQVESFKRAGMSDHIGKPFEPRELRRTIDRWIDPNRSRGERSNEVQRDVSGGKTCNFPLAPEMPHESDADNILDEAVYAQLSEMIGTEKAADIVRQFAGDLARRFADPSNQKAIRNDAHAVVSSAGALGFKSLSAAARELEYACDGSGDLHVCMTKLLDRRKQVGEFIVKRFSMADANGDTNARGQS